MAEENFRSGFSFKAVLVLFGIIILALAAHGFLWVGSSPDVQFKPAMPSIGKRTPVTIEVAEPRRGLTHVKVDLVQGTKMVTVADKNYPASSQFAF